MKMMWTMSSVAILVAAVASVGLGAQSGGTMSKGDQMDKMGKMTMMDATYTGCVEAGSAEGTFTLTHGPHSVAPYPSSTRTPKRCAQVAAVVLVYQDRPWSTWLGSASHCSVPNGSNAFGQPFQPSSVVSVSVTPCQVCHVPIFPGVALDYAILHDVLLLSASPTLVQDALRRSATPDLPDLAARKDVAAGLAALHAHPGFVGYADAVEWMVLGMQQNRSGEVDPATLELFGSGLFGTFMKMQQNVARAFPDVDHAFFERFFQAPAVSTGWTDDQGFALEMRSP